MGWVLVLVLVFVRVDSLSLNNFPCRSQSRSAASNPNSPFPISHSPFPIPQFPGQSMPSRDRQVRPLGRSHPRPRTHSPIAGRSCHAFASYSTAQDLSCGMARNDVNSGGQPGPHDSRSPLIRGSRRLRVDEIRSSKQQKRGERREASKTNNLSVREGADTSSTQLPAAGHQHRSSRAHSPPDLVHHLLVLGAESSEEADDFKTSNVNADLVG